MHRLLLPLLFLFLAGCTNGGLGGLFPSGKMPLAENSRALADIVIAPDADENLRFAADELKLHLDKITGASFSIVSRPAEGRKSLRIAYNPKLAQQELSISFSSAGVALESGGFPEYAAWDFLRDYCGVSWLDPTDAGTIIPSKPNLSVKQKNRKDRPFAKGRNPGNMSVGRSFGGAYSPELWKRGSSGWTNYLHVAYPSAFAGGSSFAAAEREIARRKNLFLRRMKAGGEISRACHSFYGWYDRFWNKKHPKFEQFRPDFFAKGYEKADRPPQLCYSNPDVIKQAVADVRAYFDNGDKNGYQWGKDACCLEPMDNGSFCLCEKCAPQYHRELALSSSQQSDYWFRFVNAVAKEVAKTHPDKKISTLAYYTHCGVPTFRLEPNVIVHYCFTCNRIPYAQRYARQEDQLRDWRAAYPDRPFGLWLYNTFPKEYADNSTFVNCFPGFFAHVLAKEYALLGSLDISEHIYNCGFVDDYENFLSLRWMWDPREPLELLEYDYFSSYGKAAAPIKEFYRIVEERYCTRANYPTEMLMKGTHQSVEFAWKVLGTPEVMRELGRLMDEAERRADTPLAKARVANWRAGIFDYMTAGAAASRNPPPSKPWPLITSP
ncbi:MAG: DUF4838 domain-containing protein [Kiritimatiellae bacterium]|nr:DUF4838 domain-containing protein [Kiritimatiellia bacterium]